MDNTFELNEKLYRAVYPPDVAEMFWRKDGTISSAAFADPRGLSVNRGNNRDFTDSLGEPKELQLSNWYFKNFVGQRKLMIPSSLIATAFIIVMLSMIIGGAIS